jgi:hypothetical protein
MPTVSYVQLTPELVARAARHIGDEMRSSGADAAALCTLDGQCAWASDAAFERLAPSIARIGIASLRLWARARTGRLHQIGLVTGDGIVDIIFVPPLVSLLVISRPEDHTGWPAGEPSLLIEALGLS